MRAPVGPSSDRELSEIARAMHLSPKVIVMTGAGLSTSAGIPDFRSPEGLYAKGDLFSETALHNETSRRRLQRFIKQLSNRGKLLRCYTQNIDMLEIKAGLSTDLNKPRVECVQLHGSLRLLRCSNCSQTFPMETNKVDFSAKDDLPCPQCVARSAARETAGRRGISVGILLPDIVRIGQQHPSGEAIAEIIHRDQTAHPHFLLILGTTLKLEGPKRLAKLFARKVKKKGGVVVYVNLTSPQAVWRDLVDYWVKWDCDNWAEDVDLRLSMLRIKDQLRWPKAGSSFNSPIVID